MTSSSKLATKKASMSAHFCAFFGIHALITPPPPPPLFNNALQWRHNGHDNVSNHQPHDCLFNRLSRRRSKKTSKLRVTGLCAGNSPGTGEFPDQMASYAKKFPFDDVIIGYSVCQCMSTRHGALPIACVVAWIGTEDTDGKPQSLTRAQGHMPLKLIIKW